MSNNNEEVYEECDNNLVDNKTVEPNLIDNKAVEPNPIVKRRKNKSKKKF